MRRPAHSQHATTTARPTATRTWPTERLVGGAARPDRQPGQRHADGDDEHEASGEPDAGLLGLSVLPALQVLDAILDEGGEAAVDVGPADLVGDEERLARGVGRRIGEARLEHLGGAGEVRGDEPLALGGGEGGTELDRSATSDLEERLGDRAAERSR